MSIFVLRQEQQKKQWINMCAVNVSTAAFNGINNEQINKTKRENPFHWHHENAACSIILQSILFFAQPSVCPRSFYGGKSMDPNNGFVLSRTKTTLTMQRIFYSLRYKICEAISNDLLSIITDCPLCIAVQQNELHETFIVCYEISLHIQFSIRNRIEHCVMRFQSEAKTQE